MENKTKTINYNLDQIRNLVKDTEHIANSVVIELHRQDEILNKVEQETNDIIHGIKKSEIDIKKLDFKWYNPLTWF